MGGVRRRAGTSARHGAVSEAGARALLSFLESHGYPPSPRGGGPDAGEIALRVADGPVPPGYLLALAERCGALFAAILEEASNLAGRGPGESAERRDSGPRAGGPPGLEEAFARIFETLGEERSGQLDMARAVDRALRGSALALVEAGTGTGKSLGYLVPAALFARETGERVVVSTYTKNLQDQLYRKETPLLEPIVPGVRAERLLGRENYLCTRGILSHAASLMEDRSGPALAFAIHLALANDGAGETGERAEGGAGAPSISAPARCPMNACAFADRCPLIRARRRAREAEILFVNHALLLTDYRQGGGVIGPYARVVLDEAHHLERCVVENLSVRAAREDCRRILEPVRLSLRNEDAWKLLAIELDAGGWGDAKGLKAAIAEDVSGIERSYSALFRAVEELLNPGKALRGTKLRYTDGGETFADARGELNDILLNISKLNDTLKSIYETDLPRDLEPFRQEMGYVSEELETLAESLRFLSAGCVEESVFWLEWGSDAALRELCGSPLEVDRPFADYLESFMGSAVLTSATLSQGGSFAFVKERLGIGLVSGKPIETIIPSPFPYDERCLVLIVTGLGDPNEDAFAARVGGVVGSLAAEVRRSTMVLFTSYRLCHAVARDLERARGGAGSVLVQGTGESRASLSGRFRRGGNALLLGVASFWEGVDFPGEELEVLVIPKVPFPVPSEPVVEARSARLSALGEDPFDRLFLPEAILRMRQGAGRLIRRMDDRGIIVILDERLETRPYGSAILAALPSQRIEHVSAAECVETAARWFSER
jgi:ATP-dependent DNA helicase DinG